ncbi:MAG: hypothetical protein LC541_18610 [Candidatus Thiodiazotropha sp.]|nr:hypothetical protein [Candidatus Thiodiazotropha sp.]MCM8885282.1 hypothetical protein [Candidatus Thiodiazotropha sp.]
MSRILLLYRSLFFIGIYLTASHISYAATIDISATVSGWVKYNGETNGLIESTTNYIAGREVGNDPSYSNYFVFDLSEVEGEIASASLKLQNPDNGFYSFDNDNIGTNECCTYTVNSMLSGGITPSNLLPENWSYPYTGIAAWSIINNGTPVNYGSIHMDESSNGTTIEIMLNEIAIIDINSTINENAYNNLFAIGGNLESTNSRVAYAFSNTGYNLFDRTLTLETVSSSTVPLPPTVLLFLSGIALFFGIHGKYEKTLQ